MNEHGITLTSLVVTIIALVILAGVTIRTIDVKDGVSFMVKNHTQNQAKTTQELDSQKNQVEKNLYKDWGI